MIKHRELTTREKKERAAWDETCKRIRSSTASLIDFNEADEAKKIRIDKLLKDDAAFCKYYFPHYMTDNGKIIEFGWFHKKAFKTILPDTLSVLEWSREHAKSILANLFVPMLMYGRGQLMGMVVASANEKKAAKLLGDIQAELENNQLWIRDFGEKQTSGHWQSGEFATKDGIGFWSFGLGQSPRGIREGAKRPNLCIVDDADTKERCKNELRVDEAVAWIREDLFGTFGLKSGTRFIIAGNRINKCSIIAKFVGDTEPDDPIDPNINHIKVYALENPRTHEMDLDGVPAWKERFTIEDLEKRWKLCGTIAKLREYFHQQVEQGNIFKEEWLIWDKVPHFKALLGIEIYCDPSFKNTATSDYKAITVNGKGMDGRIYLIDCWVRKASVKDMVDEFYRLYGIYKEYARYRMESNMVQDLLLDEFDNKGKETGLYINIRRDDRSKPDKYSRIENLTPLYERKVIIFNEAKRKDPDMQRFKTQLLNFPAGHDDAPDSQEGGVFYLQKLTRSQKFQPRQGKFVRNSNRQ